MPGKPSLGPAARFLKASSGLAGAASAPAGAVPAAGAAGGASAGACCVRGRFG
eukprot:CAMPEP_0195115962 /NCGR_PEP_ID=MMETSP0448-20130528/110569_1 /TAXON_ID=66468 /ORGANISM="Heterocapsa triquestra, Strain CCMP 448" /LENGTH=52 /DNA_ID=CAMNT_0040153095 /DNA_START=21 /DNA_END=175 /DNA_ORIENTATION=-